MLSARNQFKGTVKAVKMDQLLAEVTVTVGDPKTAGAGLEVVAVITRDSVERLGIRKGRKVTAIIKATEVMIAR